MIVRQIIVFPIVRSISHAGIGPDKQPVPVHADTIIATDKKNRTSMLLKCDLPPQEALCEMRHKKCSRNKIHSLFVFIRELSDLLQEACHDQEHDEPKRECRDDADSLEIIHGAFREDQRDRENDQ